MRINIVINDDTIRRDVLDAISEQEESFGLSFPSPDEKEEFIAECIETVIQKYELYDDYIPNYSDLVSDLAAMYGF